MSAIPRDTAPSLGAITAAWMDLGVDELKATFSREFVGVMCGWSEPFCFRCGWLTPTRNAFDYSPKFSDERRYALAWNAAGGWLDRAHLKDHQHGGGAEPLNLVPMCVLCHKDQPECATREDGLAFVRSRSRLAEMQWVAQCYTDAQYTRAARPDRHEAHRRLLRAYAEAGGTFAKAMAQLLAEEQEAA